MNSILFEPFFQRAMLAGLAVALVSGPVGCFIVWRRMAYFGESLAHSGLLGVGLGLLFSLNITLGAVATAIVFALLLLALRRQQGLATDTLLGILSYTSLALGLIVVGLATGAASALMVIPAAAARRLATTPEHMAFIAAAIAGLSVVSGLLASAFIGGASGPCVVLAASCFFALTLAVP